MTSLTAASRAAAAGLELTVLRRLDGLLQGDHAGLLPAHGSETGEARLYEPGDDTRRLDWALTARTTTPHVRDTIADHELELWLLVDDSASLAFGTARYEKHDVAWAAAGAFALLASRGGNRVGAMTTTGRQGAFPARSGRHHVGAVLASLRRSPEDGDGGRSRRRAHDAATARPPPRPGGRGVRLPRARAGGRTRCGRSPAGRTSSPSR